MNQIKVMAKDLANKIAAGEVIEKTYNVVKELVENAIDAESSIIKVELLDGGIKKIKVSDNGLGMNSSDALLCFTRHASSKLLKLEDLFNIQSLGFRGEALPSIASVAKVSLKTSDGHQGTSLKLEDSEVKEVKEISFNKGTTIEVTELFYNTPVRLKYLKSIPAELANISDYVNKMALAYPNIKFILTNNDHELLNTDGSGNLLKVIAKVYGVESAKKMIAVNFSDEDYQIEGYISYPELTKSNRNSINLFVNQRYIKSTYLVSAIKEAYQTYIPSDKYPIIVLNITLDPKIVDVNIHPSKLEINFSKAGELKELIINNIAKELEMKDLIPEIKTFYEEKEALIYKTEEALIVPQEEYESIGLDFEELAIKASKKEDLKKIYALALVHGTYIVGENEEGMYLADQHAAAERINYEYYLQELSKETYHKQTILFPEQIELTTDESLKLKEKMDLFTELGFTAEEFGVNTILIREHPSWLKEKYLRESIIKIIEIVISKEKFEKSKFIDNIAITLACKLSIKANEYLSLEDMQNLLDRLMETDNPFTCPHGRPTIIKYSNYDLEKLFKRVMN